MEQNNNDDIDKNSSGDNNERTFNRDILENSQNDANAEQGIEVAASTLEKSSPQIPLHRPTTATPTEHTMEGEEIFSTSTPREQMGRSFSFGELSAHITTLSASTTLSSEEALTAPTSPRNHRRRRASLTPSSSKTTRVSFAFRRDLRGTISPGSPRDSSFDDLSTTSSPQRMMTEHGVYQQRPMEDVNRSLLSTLADLKAFAAEYTPRSSRQRVKGEDSPERGEVEVQLRTGRTEEEESPSREATDPERIDRASLELPNLETTSTNELLPEIKEDLPEMSPRKTTVDSVLSAGSLVGSVTGENRSNSNSNQEGVELDLDEELARLEQQFLSELGQHVEATTTTAADEATHGTDNNFMVSLRDLNLDNNDDNDGPPPPASTGTDRDTDNNAGQMLAGKPSSETNRDGALQGNLVADVHGDSVDSGRGLAEQRLFAGNSEERARGTSTDEADGTREMENFDDTKMEQSAELGQSFFDTRNDSFTGAMEVQFTTDQDASTIDAGISTAEREDSFLTATGAEARSFDGTEPIRIGGEIGLNEETDTMMGNPRDSKAQPTTNLAESTAKEGASAAGEGDSFLSATAGSFDTDILFIDPEPKSRTLLGETPKLEIVGNQNSRATPEPIVYHPKREEIHTESESATKSQSGEDERMTDSSADGTIGSPSNFEQGLGSSFTQTKESKTKSTDSNAILSVSDKHESTISNIEADDAIQEALSLLRNFEENNEVQGSNEGSEFMNAMGSSEDILRTDDMDFFTNLMAKYDENLETETVEKNEKVDDAQCSPELATDDGESSNFKGDQLQSQDVKDGPDDGVIESNDDVISGVPTHDVTPANSDVDDIASGNKEKNETELVDHVEDFLAAMKDSPRQEIENTAKDGNNSSSQEELFFTNDDSQGDIGFVESNHASPYRKLGDSVSSIGETETFLSPGDFFAKPKIALALEERHSLAMLPDASEVSFASRSEDLQSESENNSGMLQKSDGGRKVDGKNVDTEKREMLELDDSQSAVAPPLSKDEAAVEPVGGDKGEASDNQGIGDIFRPRDSSTEGDKRRMDFSAVSSVTSASSPNALRVFQATGIISPIKLDESKIRSKIVNEDGNKPPLFPRNTTDRKTKQPGLNESRHQLSRHSKDESTVGYGTPTLSQFLKAEESASYNIEESVFALMEDSSSSSLSPPGPGGNDMDEQSDESSSFGTEGTPLSHSEVDDAHPGAAIWNMLSQNSPRRSIHESKRPEFVLMPQSEGYGASKTEEWGASPSGSVASDRKGASFHRTVVREAATTGLRPLGTGVHRGRFSSRRAGANTISLSRRQLAFRLELQKALSDEAFPSAVSPGDQQDSDSAFGGSLSTDIFIERRPSHPVLRHSSPDLRILHKTPTALLDQLENTSPDPFPRGLTRSHSVNFGDRGGLDHLQGPVFSPELSSPRKPFDRSPASHSLIESVNSNGIPLDKQNIQFEEAESEDDTANDESHLEAALKDFSTLPPVEFPSTMRLHSGDVPGYIASLRWRQLVARFSHNEVFTISCKKPTSLHLDSRGAAKDPEKRDSSGGIAIARNAPFELELQGQQWRIGDISARYANRDGLPPHDGDPALPQISSFVTDVVGVGAEKSDPLRQPASSPSLARGTSVTELIETGSKYEETLNALIEHVSSFAVETDFGYLPFTVSLKDPEAAEWKAKSKYSGDQRQVKDYLRGRIIFPDEGSLVCAIVKLFQLGDNFSFTSKKGEQEQVKLGIVRMKNLFKTKSSGNPDKTTDYQMPTGYRHILLNVVFNDEFIAEIQCNLLSLFAVMGEDGPILHRDIRKLENVCGDRDLGDKLLITSIEAKLHSDPADLNEYFARNHNISDRSLEEGKEEVTDQKAKAARSANGDLEGAPTDVDDQTKLVDRDQITTEESQDTDVGSPINNNSISPSNRSASGTPDSPLERVLFDAATPKAGRTVHQIVALKEQIIPLLRTETEILDEIADKKKEISFVDVCKAFLYQAVKHLEEHPHDVATLRCFLSTVTLISRISCQVEGEKECHLSSQMGIPVLNYGLDQHIEALLNRFLAIGYQDSSVGMIGWVALMEHGNNTAPRVGERPLEILHEIGACFAEQGRWTEAEEVYRTLVLRCERQLPLYHPVAIAGMLDLAVCAIENSRADFGNMIIARTSERVSAYLAEMEHSHTMHCQQSLAQSQSGLLIFEIDKGRKSLSMLEAFAEKFGGLLNRKLITLIPSHHEVYLAQRCILADCFVVIANCWALKELSVQEKRSTHFWRSAFSHYRAVFRGSANVHGLDDPRVASAAYGLARVLRELGKLSDALKVLTPVVKALSHPVHGPDALFAKQSFSFIPQPVTVIREGVDQRMVTAQCHWLMAVLTADSSPDDDGRTKALKCLHKASIALRHILDTSVQEDPRRKECVRLLRQIEDEARRIFHPLRRPTTLSHTSRDDRRG
eukprot:scaffold8126_cov170-Amphora_coffeaeformis.AAC.3